jgi:hypothetical protein
MSPKNPVTQPGIDPGTIQLVAQHLNHYATSGPYVWYSWGKVTDKVVLVHYTNSYWCSGSIALLILNLATTTWGVVSFTPWLLYIQYWVGGRMGHRPSVDALEKRSLSLLGIKPWFLSYPAHSLMCCNWGQKCKSKFHPITGHKVTDGEYMYSSTLSLTSVVDWGGWSVPCPNCFTPGKETYYPLLVEEVWGS